MTGCNLTYVPCNDGVGCYSIEHLCDGIKQCIDGTDEKSCGDVTSTLPIESTTQCTNGLQCMDPAGRQICLSISDLCDGYSHCVDSSDETDCTPESPDYLIPSIVGLAAACAIVLIMVLIYRVCLYRYSSTHSFLCCPGRKDPHHHGYTETRIEIDQIEKKEVVIE
eukprot:sb/3472493/